MYSEKTCLVNFNKALNSLENDLIKSKSRLFLPLDNSIKNNKEGDITILRPIPHFKENKRGGSITSATQ